MQNKLEYALSDGRWGDAARILEKMDGDTVIADTWARKMLAAFLRENDKGTRGRPSKFDWSDQLNMEEQSIIAELRDLVKNDWKKEAAKVEVAKRHGISRGILEQLDAKYRDIPIK